jgi:hypothetical protein
MTDGIVDGELHIFREKEKERDESGYVFGVLKKGECIIRQVPEKRSIGFSYN